MSKYWSARVKNLTPYVPGEQPKDRLFIKLNTNENPYPPSPKVIEAIKKAADESLRLYPDPECVEAREAIANYYNVKPGQVFVGNGSDEVLAFVFAAFFQSDMVLFPDITYSFYHVYAGLWDIPYRAIPLTDDFLIDIDNYKIPSGGVIFPNPNAPTGISVQLDGILSLAEYLEERGSVLIVDEAYAAFGAQSAVSRVNEYPNLLTVHTMSKQMSLAGLRVGYAIGNEELIEGLRRVRDSFNSYTLDRLAMAGAAAAFGDAGYYDKINRNVIETRERTAKELRALKFLVLPSAANFLFIKPPYSSGAEFSEALREKGILVRRFNKDRIADFLRVSIGTDDEMNKFLEICENLT